MEKLAPGRKWTDAITLTVIVAALGYFADMFGITMFGVVRVQSLKALGITDPKAILESGVLLYNSQMIGMMVGGILWGILADKKGRLGVMFGSILLYSLGSIVNSFVTSVDAYAVCRFFTGIGLAGQLGAAITIVAETLPKDLRGVGTTIVATLGLVGSVSATLVGKMDWKTSYLIGGVMGLSLLVTWFFMRESFMIKKAEDKHVQRGNVAMLFEPRRFRKYLFCVMAGAPIYFMSGILLTFAPELGRALNVQGEYTAGNALLFGTLGLTVGDLLSGMLSQTLKSRKKAIFSALVMGFILSGLYLLRPAPRAEELYVICFLIGVSGGYWAVMVTTAAEQFGTNIRGTVATTVPNFIRGTGVLATLGFTYMKGIMPLQTATLVLAAVWFTAAIFALFNLEETFSKDLDYFEMDNELPAGAVAAEKANLIQS